MLIAIKQISMWILRKLLHAYFSNAPCHTAEEGKETDLSTVWNNSIITSHLRFVHKPTVTLINYIAMRKRRRDRRKLINESTVIVSIETHIISVAESRNYRGTTRGLQFFLLWVIFQFFMSRIYYFRRIGKKRRKTRAC